VVEGLFTLGGSEVHVSLNYLTKVWIVLVVLTYDLFTCMKEHVLVTGSNVQMVVKLPGKRVKAATSSVQRGFFSVYHGWLP